MIECNTLCNSCTKDCKQAAFAAVIECPKYQYNGAKLPKVMPAQKGAAYRELSTYEKGAIKSLVTSRCANYDPEYNICLLLDTACPMLLMHFYRGKLCKYFQNAVLPLDTKLELSLQEKKHLAKKCNTCGLPFLPNGRQAYCSEECRKTGKRKSTAKSMRKYRGRK